MIISREAWGAAYGRGSSLYGAKPLVVLHHSWKPHVECGETQKREREAMRGMETFHAVTNGWDGIGYNLCVFQSGRVYQGRGWNRIGAHVAGQNSRSVGICIVIDGDAHLPTLAAIEAVRELIHDGMAAGHIAPDFVLRGHRDFSPKSCPGKFVYSMFARFDPREAT